MSLMIEATAVLDSPNRGGESGLPRDRTSPPLNTPLHQLPLNTAPPSTIWCTLVYSGLLWLTLVYSGVHIGTLWYTLVYSGLLWFTLVYSGLHYSGLLWFTLVYSGVHNGTPWYTAQ